MTHSRRCFLQTVALGGVAWLTAHGQRPSPRTRVERINQALSNAARFLSSQQSEDGAWRIRCLWPIQGRSFAHTSRAGYSADVRR